MESASAQPYLLQQRRASCASGGFGMSAANKAAAVENGLSDAGGTGLRGSMSTIELIFTVVAYNGPVVVFLGFIPAAVLLGNGVGTPVTFLVCGLVTTMVAVGLITMAKRLNKPGGFYA